MLWNYHHWICNGRQKGREILTDLEDLFFPNRKSWWSWWSWANNGRYAEEKSTSSKFRSQTKQLFKRHFSCWYTTCDMSINFIYSNSGYMIIMLHKVTLPTPTRKRQKPRQKRKPSSLSPSPSLYLTGLANSWGVDWASVTSTLLRAASVADLEPEKTSKLLNLELRIHLGICFQI